jgi:hypothetical protein
MTTLHFAEESTFLGGLQYPSRLVIKSRGLYMGFQVDFEKVVSLTQIVASLARCPIQPVALSLTGLFLLLTLSRKKVLYNIILS